MECPRTIYVRFTENRDYASCHCGYCHTTFEYGWESIEAADRWLQHHILGMHRVGS
jgi:hypothetical protein